MKTKIFKCAIILMLCIVSFAIVNYFCTKINESKQEITKLEYQKVMECYMDISLESRASFNKILNDYTSDFKISKLEYKSINKRYSCELLKNSKWKEFVNSKTQ